uniref:Tetratricopeptide repeat protein 39B n=1 Tax=Gadus morhua TaxID=8049 RepID=A0A8C5FGV0_GADMO
MEDKKENQTTPMDLEHALVDCSAGLELFLNNRFSDALAHLKPWKAKSMYHAMGYSSMLVMQAGMTFDPKDVEAAMTSLRESLETCQRYFRKKSGLLETITNLWYRQSSDNLTEEEMHAELCYAEVLLQKASLTFMDESIMGFIKGGMRIRNTLLKNALLVMFQDVGLSELRAGVATNGLRSILSMLTLLMYHLYITVILGTGEVDLTEAENLLEPYIKKFPNGALILFYTARIALLKGNFTFAREKYLACITAQQEWRQIHHLCYWELMWAHSFEQEWKKAYHYADLLSKESKWSQSTYMYQKAALLSMLPDAEVEAMGQNAEDLFKQVEGLRLRIAGKSVPTEKFAAKKAQRCSSSRPTKPVLPALEMMYVWNGFTIVGKRPELTYSILSTIQKAEDQLASQSDHHVDDQCVVQLLKGLCLRQLGSLDEAEGCFNQVISSEQQIKYDDYLVPFTMYELGLIYKQRGDTHKAVELLEKIKVTYKDYSMESRLHFRIHAALNTMGTFPNKPYPSRIQA